MAIEKTLNTRILMKVDTLENWGSSTLKLKKGELAFATVAASAGTGLSDPVVMVKIGTEEEKTFAELPWAFHAKASDVLTACKSEAGLTAFIKNVIAASDGDLASLAARVTTAEGEIDTLQSEMDAVEAKAAANETAIGGLGTLVGDKAVATQIFEAIAALDLANTYETKGEAAKVQTALDTYKTSNDAAVQKNATDIAGEISRAKAAEEANAGAITAIKDGTTIDSFADVEAALAGKQAAGDYATKAEAQAMADGKDAAIAEAKKAGTDAAAAAAAAQADADALEALVGDTKVSEQISGAIDDLDLANTYAAKVHTHVKADITDFAHTHTKSEITDFAHTHEISEVNGLQTALDGKQAAGDYADAEHTHTASEITDLDSTIKAYDYATKTEAQGYADAKNEAIAAAKKAGDDAQADVDALSAKVGTVEEGKTIVGMIDDAQAAATYDDTEVKADIAALEGLVGDTAVATQISTAVATEEARAEGVESGLESRLATVEGDYLKAADKKALQDQIDANESAIELLTNGVSADEVDGVNDLIQYVKDHGTEVTGMKEDISDNADAIAAEQERAEGVESGLDTRLQAVEAAVGETGSVATAIEGAVTEAKGYTDAEVEKLAEGAVATNAAAIAALELQVGDGTVSEQITAVTDPLAERIEDLEAIDHEHSNKALLDTYTQTEADLADAVAKKHEHANKAELDLIESGDKAAWDAKVDDVTAVADSGLKATRTGNTVAIEIDESVTFIFDCGTSAE